jgi:hypothetical protein
MFDTFQLRLSLPSLSPTAATSRSALPGRRARRPPFSFLIIAFGILLVVSVTFLRPHDADAALGPSDEALWTNWGEWGDMTDIMDRFGTGVEKGKDILGLGACAGWDPLKDEERDPVGCLRAKQYRQVQRVLKREIKGTQ